MAPSLILLLLLLPASLGDSAAPADEAADEAALAADEQCTAGSDCALSALQLRSSTGAGDVPHYSTSWKELIVGTSCPSETALLPKGGGVGGSITCHRRSGGGRHFKFPVGKFDIDEQVNVPAGTVIEGNANPNDPSDKTKKPNPSTQTYFIATKGVSDHGIAYCGTNNNLRPGDAQKLRIGFLLNSNTVVRNINFQGKDTKRPHDNGSLCGGAVFETPGCVSPGFCDGRGHGWVGRRGCSDHAGRSNSLITGDGKGVANVVIDSVRLNDLFLPADPAHLGGAPASQIAVWIAQTQDGSATRNVTVKNLVSMATRGDGINFHGNVQDSVVEDSHIENTGDDIYAIWGGWTAKASGIIFRNNVGKNAGVLRGYGYGVCMAVYGVKQATVTGLKCYDRRHWNGKCINGLPYCNSCLAYIHETWFGAVYPHGNTINFCNNEYLYMDAPTQRITDRPLIRTDNRGAHVGTC